MKVMQIFMGVRKELWEFKKTLFWMPLLIGIFMIAAPLLKLLLLEGAQIRVVFEGVSNADNLNNVQGLTRLFLATIMGMFAPFILVGLVIQLYYFTTCLFDERRDQSIYFWRSLPVSDGQNIMVKLLTGALVVPAIFMLAATLVVFIFVLLGLLGCYILDVGYDISLWELWGNANIFSNMTSVWTSLLFYALWMFPLFSWLMLASMFANKAPFLWAVLPVALLLVIESYITNYLKLDSHFLREALLEYFALAKELIPNSIQQVGTPKFILISALWNKISLIGTALGIGFIYLTYWLRVNRSHL
ncbi:hypothetical protein [uncultured Paraglaciecola sp.]|uniref:hypothetical protein n=1 Tax=uncultured Paraglaciecola sp. TaxID=1765024 RepID=UPI0025997541|nr:hypothetical protein [uncultured Paraglaciecola sp.]